MTGAFDGVYMREGLPIKTQLFKIFILRFWLYPCNPAWWVSSVPLSSCQDEIVTPVTLAKGYLVTVCLATVPINNQDRRYELLLLRSSQIPADDFFIHIHQHSFQGEDIREFPAVAEVYIKVGLNAIIGPAIS